MKMIFITLLALGCTDASNPSETNENEVITTITLHFEPQSGGDAFEAVWTDPENDGSPVIDDLVLDEGETYDFSVSFLNGLESPPEDITAEVASESDEHQVFFLGEGVAGPASESEPAILTHAYTDTDPNGLPIGLQNTLIAETNGAATLQVVLRHLPMENDVATKTEDLAGTVASSGVGALPGDSDADVSFPVIVE